MQPKKHKDKLMAQPGSGECDESLQRHLSDCMH